MLNIDDYILGNSALHDRFCASTEILAKIVSSAPRPVNLAQLEHESGRSAAELELLCDSLTRGGLLRRHESQRDCWVLARRSTDATLEDVFRSVIGDQGKSRNASRPQSQAQPEVALLLMQATMAINQSVFRHLGQFPLDRLKTRPASPSLARTQARQPLRGLRYPEGTDFGVSRFGI